MKWQIIIPFSLLISGCTPGETPWFKEESQLRGINFVHHSGFDSRPLMPEMMGGGVALADFDGDDDLDLYLVPSGRVDEIRPSELSAHQLYLNRGDGYFDRKENAGGADEEGYGMGVAAGDYDNDGDIDLYVTNLGANKLFQNNGEGIFSDVTQLAGVGDKSWGTAATFLDLDADGDLDLFVVNYLHWSKNIEQDCYGKAFFVTYCGPTVYDAPAMDTLYRNNGDGSFTDITKEAGINVAFGNGLGTVGADFNKDGLMDIFVANDTLVNQLWINQGDLEFVEECLLWSCAMDSNGIAKAGMGVASADVDDDADPDLLVVNLVRQSDSFFRNEGSYFFDATSLVGIVPVSMRHTRFGVTLTDLDNDSRLDLYEVNGKVEMQEPAEGDGFAEPNVLLKGALNNGRVSFSEVKPQGGVSPSLKHTSRGLAVGDVDNNGSMDLVITNRDAAPYLLINTIADKNNWVRFKVITNNRDAYGATVSVKLDAVQMNRDVQPSASYLASSDPRVHFGLGKSTSVKDVRVIWPGGKEEIFGDYAAGETYKLIEGLGDSVSE